LGLGIGLQLVPQFQQMPAAALQLARQLRAADALADPTQDQHPLTTTAMRLLQQRAGKYVEDAAAGATAIIEDRISMTPVHAKGIAPAAFRAAQAIGMQCRPQTFITPTFVHQIGNWEVHNCSSVSSRHCTTIGSVRQRLNTAGGS
jgi:hypothetical protein